MRIVAAWVAGLLILLVVGAGCSGSSSSDAPTTTAAAAKVPVHGCWDVRVALDGVVGEIQRTVQVVVTNRDVFACQIGGFPTVELIGDPDHVFGGVYQLPRQRAKATPVTLEEGESASFTLTWLPDDQPGHWTPGYLRIELPHGSPVIGRWTLGGIVRQDAATHPGSYVGPFR